MLSDIQQKLIVVIRTVNERTFKTCRSLVLRQVSKQIVHVVNDQPFEATLKRCYQIGIDSSAEWMMTLDADILLREGAVESLLSAAQRMPPDYIQAEGLVFDKLTGLYRKAGHRIYRIQHLKTAIRYIPEHRVEIRPEFSVLTKMMSLGFPSLEISEVYGIHDYEQYYADIYRKAFIHANKHPEWISRFVNRWKENAPIDSDYLVGLRGLYDGLLSQSEKFIDRRDYTLDAKRALKELGITEKSQLEDEDKTEYVKSILNQAGPIPNSKLKKATKLHKKNLREKYLILGPWRLIPYLFGASLCKLGNKIISSIN